MYILIYIIKLSPFTVYFNPSGCFRLYQQPADLVSETELANFLNFKDIQCIALQQLHWGKELSSMFSRKTVRFRDFGRGAVQPASCD